MTPSAAPLPLSATEPYQNGIVSKQPPPTLLPTQEQEQEQETSTSKFLSRPSELAVQLIGFSGGQPRPGTDYGPAALLAGGILAQLEGDLGYTLYGDTVTRNYNDYRVDEETSTSASSSASNGDRDVVTTAVTAATPATVRGYRGMKNAPQVSAVAYEIAKSVSHHALQGRFVLTLGGDHSIALGTVSGTSSALRTRFPSSELAVIWVDAHADLNTPETSLSGNIHGMPLSFLTGITSLSSSTCTKANPQNPSDNIFSWLNKNHTILPSKLVYIGLRDVDRGEKLLLRTHNIKAFSMHDIDREGIGAIMSKVLSYIGPSSPIHISFDIDALDPVFAPSTGTPVRGGLTLREGNYICECVAETKRLVAMDLVEVNPDIEVKGVEETVRAGISLVRSALGDTLL